MRVTFALCGLVCISAFVPLTAADKQPQYVIHRAGSQISIDGKLDEEAWRQAPSVGDFVFAWYKEGKKEQTVAKLLWDDTHLYVAYVCEDAHISATRTRRNSDVWNDDCVEVFTAPNPHDPDNYFNIEMNVNGACLEGHHPMGPDSKPKERWHADGMRIATSIDGTKNNDSDTDTGWTLEAAIPFDPFAHVARHAPPQPGDTWRLNLNRLGGMTNPQFSQWSPSSTPQPQFHAPRDFGYVTFSDNSVP